MTQIQKKDYPKIEPAGKSQGEKQILKRIKLSTGRHRGMAVHAVNLPLLIIPWVHEIPLRNRDGNPHEKGENEKARGPDTKGHDEFQEIG